MPPDETGPIPEVRYTRELGPRQAISLGLRSSLPVVAFLALGPLTKVAGVGAPLALLLGIVVWAPTVLTYLELLSQCPEGGIYYSIAKHRTGLFPFLATWVLLLGSLLAVGMLAQQTAKLAVPWLQSYLPGYAQSSTQVALSVAVLAVAILITVLRRRLWRREDDWVLAAGFLAVVLTAAGAFLGPPPQPATGSLPGLDFRGILSGTVPPVLILLAVEAISEWKGDLRQPGSRIPRIVVAALTVLVGGSLILLLSGLRLDGDGLAEGGLASVLGNLNVLGGWRVVTPLFALVMLAAMSSLLLQANRLLRLLAREGYVPRLDRRGGRVGTPVTVLIVSVVSAGTFFVSESIAFDALVGMLMLFAVAINAAGTLFHPTSEDVTAGDADGSPASSLFILPFPPLVPLLGLAIALFLVATVSSTTVLSMAVALGLGLLVYLVYGRVAHRAAQESKTVFRRHRRTTETAETKFRVLVPLLGSPAEQRALVDMAVAMASSEQGEVLALQVITVPALQTRAEGARLAREHNQLLQWSLGKDDYDVPVTPMTRIGRDPARAIVDTAREEDADLIMLTWRPTAVEDSATFSRTSAAERGRLVSELVRGAPCMVAALDGGLKGEVKRILVPTAGGPHAPVAARFALDLAQLWGAQVVGLNIVRSEAEDAMEEARRNVQSTFQDLPGADQVEVRLVTSQEPVAAALVKEANQDYDLLLLGASNEGLLDRVLFGDIPQQVAEQTDTPAIMVRSARPAQEAMARLLWDRAQSILPVLDGEEQIELYRTLRRGARPSVNFFVLIVLSAIIATLGLWQNSGAVIIGAMLVAPLMTPILATSLGIIMGDIRMIRVSAEATVKGVVAGVAIALFVTLLLPQQRVGTEIMARTQPTVLDLVVALASGAAGAYALARKEVSAALPGVAIAAALMPPICTVGIGLASFKGLIAGGALLLFTTNLIAITVAGGLVFLLLGMRPRRGEQQREEQFRRGLLLALVLLVVISVPLTWLGLRSAEQITNQNNVDRWLKAAVTSTDHAELLDATVSRRGKTLDVYARIQTEATNLDQGTVDAWSTLLAQKTGRPVNLQVDIQPVVKLRATTGPP